VEYPDVCIHGDVREVRVFWHPILGGAHVIGGQLVVDDGATVTAGGLQVLTGGSTIASGGLAIVDGGANINTQDDHATPITIIANNPAYTGTIIDMTTGRNRYLS
jgi:hypothetical protein